MPGIISGKISGKKGENVRQNVRQNEQHDCVLTTLKPQSHSVNNRPVKRLTLVASLPRAVYIGPQAGWNYGIVTPFL